MGDGIAIINATVTGKRRYEEVFVKRYVLSGKMLLILLLRPRTDAVER